MAGWLNQVLATPLHGQGVTPVRFALRDVDRHDTIRELSYTLAVDQMDLDQLMRCVQDEFGPQAGIAASTWNGFLNGFIDLVVRVDGQYWMVDWKSNWLAPRAGDYTRTAMAEAMRDHAYYLQLSLYLLALHRMLRLRLPDYDYDTHMGGAHYLFLRGMDGREGDTGVYSVCPPRQMIEQLDEIAGCPASNRLNA